MATLVELQDKRDKILGQIDMASVQEGDRSVQFVIDKQKSLAILDREIAALQSPQPKQFVIQTSRGL